MRAKAGRASCLAAAVVAFALMFAERAAAQAVTTIRNNGSSANRVDFVVMGDGYTSAEIASGKYASDVEKFVAAMFAQEPYLEYQSFYNVHRVDVASAESGSDHPELGTFKNTALDSAYNCGNIQRLICVNTTKVNTVLSQTGLASNAKDQVLVFVNDPTYGGSGGSLAVASTHSDVVELILHELGHSIGLLADEYGDSQGTTCPNIEPSQPNATRQTERSQIKWNTWIDPATPLPTTTTANGVPGLYVGANYCDTGAYRPTFNSKMRSLFRPFEQINTEQHIKRVYNFVSPIDATSPAGSTIDVAAGQSQAFSVTPLAPRTHALDIVWQVDGATAGTAATFSAGSTLSSGDHTVTLTVRDTTSSVRTDASNVLRATRTWTLRVGPGNSCTFAIAPASVSVGSAATSGTVALTTQASCAWTAVSSNTAVATITSAANGTGSATISYAVSANTGTSQRSATLTIGGQAFTIAQAAAPAAGPPFGVFDTPVGDATVLAGSIAVTGWALDNTGVQRLELWRDLQPGETTPPFASTPTDPRNGKVFIANAPFVDGARPDVEALYPSMPFKSRAGWGYLLLTWGLWNQGNGTYKLYAYAFDLDNNIATIGSKTIIVSNNAATKPFGSIDTPAIGGVASGPNFGWALTPKVNGVATCKIQPSGVQVSIDSKPLQPVVYGDLRSDIAGAFPGFSNSNGAGGNYLFDWSTLTVGAHTIGWFVTDDCNRADGVGSRFFNVTASGSAVAGAAGVARVVPPEVNVVAAPQSESADAITVARGYGQLPVIVPPGEAGSRTIEVKQGERVEVRVPRGFETAYQLVDGKQRALPTGASWDASSGTLYWQPAAGFLGRYRIVFAGATERISVRVVVLP